MRPPGRATGPRPGTQASRDIGRRLLRLRCVARLHFYGVSAILNTLQISKLWKFARPRTPRAAAQNAPWENFSNSHSTRGRCFPGPGRSLERFLCSGDCLRARQPAPANFQNIANFQRFLEICRMHASGTIWKPQHIDPATQAPCAPSPSRSRARGQV